MPEPDLPEQQHQLAARDVEVDVRDAERAVVVDGGDARAAPASCSGSRVRGASAAGPSPLTRSTPGGQAHQVGAAGERGSSRASTRASPGASVTTEPATRPNQSKPLTALATSSAVARSQPAE